MTTSILSRLGCVVTCFSLLVAASDSDGGDYRVGDVVAVIRDAPLMAAGKANDRVGRGFVLVVEAVEPNGLRVSRGFPGRLDPKCAIPVESATNHFSEALRRDPNDAEAYWARGNVEEELESPDKAKAEFEEAIRKDSRFAPAYSSLAARHSEDGDYDQAIQYYNKAFELYEQLPHVLDHFAPLREQAIVLSNRGLTHLSRNSNKDAMEDFDDAIGLEPAFCNAYIGRAIAHLRREDPASALCDLNKAIQLDSHNGDAYQCRGITFAQLDEHEKAIDDFDRAIRIFRRLLTGHAGTRTTKHLKRQLASATDSRALEWARVKNYRRAFADFDQAGGIDPEYADVHVHRAEIHWSRNEHADALACFGRAIHARIAAFTGRETPRLSRAIAEVLTSRGYLHVCMGQRDLARADYVGAIRTDSQYARAYYQRCLLSIGEARYAEALTDIQQAILLEPERELAYRVQRWLEDKLAKGGLRNAGSASSSTVRRMRIDNSIR